jgi:hypothetical protein
MIFINVAILVIGVAFSVPTLMVSFYQPWGQYKAIKSNIN